MVLIKWSEDEKCFRPYDFDSKEKIENFSDLYYGSIDDMKDDYLESAKTFKDNSVGMFGASRKDSSPDTDALLIGFCTIP